MKSIPNAFVGLQWRRRGLGWLALAAGLASIAQAAQSPARPPTDAAQSVATPASDPIFVGHGRVEGHLALNYSPAAAFSPDSQTLAVVVGSKVALLRLADFAAAKMLHPQVAGLEELSFDSANFLAPTRLLLLAHGRVRAKRHRETDTPLLALEWLVHEDTQVGKIDAVGAGGGFNPILYLPQLGAIAMYKASQFTLWNPTSHRAAQFTIAGLASQPGVFTVSPDGRWILLGRVANNASPDPIVVDAKAQKFVDILRGHQASVLSINFSRDGSRVVTACEDGKVRVFSTGDWQLLKTLSGHNGPVHWAEFSSDGRWIASAGEDHTLRIWSAADGRMLQTLEESRRPLLTAAFSPNGRYVAASSDQDVLVWQQH